MSMTRARTHTHSLGDLRIQPGEAGAQECGQYSSSQSRNVLDPRAREQVCAHFSRSAIFLLGFSSTPFGLRSGKCWTELPI